MKRKKTNNNSGKTLPKKSSSISEMMVEAMIIATAKVKEENKRWGMPLILWRDGKIVQIPPSDF